jgi:predicted nucleotidyltransferase
MGRQNPVRKMEKPLKATATIASMAKKSLAGARYVQPYRYPSPNIPLSAIRRFARQIAEQFHPERIILFGSYAYGRPHNESDVDLLVIMPAHDVIAQEIRIGLALDRPFSHDIIVRTPKQIERGLREDDCDWFLREVLEKGKVLYEAPHKAVDSQGRGGHRGRQKPRGHGKTETRRNLFPLPTVGGKVPQGSVARARPRRAKNARP